MAGRDSRYEVLPASLRMRRFVQCLTIMASGRTRSSIWMYVLIMRVFSRAAALLTFMSHESCSSGSQTFTIRTLAAGMHTTRSMPSGNVSIRTVILVPVMHTLVECLCKHVHLLEPFHGRLDADVNCRR